MLKEFKEFAIKGNMLDLAIGFILGAAFSTVVKSLVDDIIMPLVSAVLGSPDFTNLFVVLKDPADVASVNMTSIEAVREAGGIALGYGLFINAVIAFLIMAFILYLIVKNVNKLREPEEKIVEEPAGPTQEELLADIRDLLKKG
ncbi:MAG: large conductance mechanosensitive channel protein MscL [Saprospiraceae bacterium]|nr:large conductance mechanosensitive channel protein MscL [Saprospiraceae bacterium]